MNEIVWEMWKDPIKESLEGYEDSAQKFERRFLNNLADTPVGPIPKGECECPSDIWNIKVGNTNFDIFDHLKPLQKLAGVEWLAPISRYRFLMAFGKLFDEEEVKSNMLGLVNQKKVVEYGTLDIIMRNLSKKFPHWAIIKNGNHFELIGDSDKELVLRKIEGFNIVKSSWEK